MVPLHAADAPAKGDRISTYLTWTPTTLYVGFRVDDPMVVGNQTMPLGQPWQDDSVAVYLDLQPDGADVLNQHCRRIIVSAAGGATAQRFDGETWVDDLDWFRVNPRGTIRYGVTVQGKINDRAAADRGYVVEMGLSWALLGVEPPIPARPGDPAPEMGLALVNAAQGETQSVTLWPPALTETNLSNPSSWARLRFTTGLVAQPATGNAVAIPLTGGGPLIDGRMDVPEWMMAGVITFERRAGEPADDAGEAARVASSLVAAWYVLDNETITGAHHPLIPLGPEVTAEMPLYHRRHIHEARMAGIDALAVVLPVDARERTRTRLAALMDAVRMYDRQSSAAFFTDCPLLLPVIDGSPALDLREEEGQRVVETSLRDFFALVPPQYRVIIPDAHNHPCYPVMVTTGTRDDARAAVQYLTVTLAPRLRETGDLPIGWLLDDAWLVAGKADGVLAYCGWDASRGTQQSDGPLRVTLLTPGIDASRKTYLSRREGELYENGWLKVVNTHPELVVIRSWNDFAHGTEIAPSRQYGYQFADRTKVMSIRMTEDQPFPVRLLRHDLPPVLAAGQTYAIDALVRNAGMTRMTTREGYRVRYRIMAGEREVADGLATEELSLFELASARLRFNLPVKAKNGRALAPGSYRLLLEFQRKRLRIFTGAMFTKKLGAFVIPFTVGADTDAVQVLRVDAPNRLLVGATAPATVEFRRLGDAALWKTPAVFRMRWADDTGVPLGDGTVWKGNMPATGALTTVQGTLPPAPAQPGWYRLQVLVSGTMIHQATVQIIDSDMRAQFLEVALPPALDGAEVEVPVTVRNSGLSAWPATSRITWRWLGWDGQPLPDGASAVALEREIPAGGVVSRRVRVPLPAGAGSVRCAFRLECAGQPAVLDPHPLDDTAPVCATTLRAGRYAMLDLQPAFNAWAAQPETTLDRVDLDGNGAAFPQEEFLPDRTNPPGGYPVGYGLTAAMPTVGFAFSPRRNGKAPMIRATGQEITLPPRTANALYLVALNTGDAEPVSFTIHYQHGDDQVTPLTIANWVDVPADGDAVILKSRYLRTTKGDDWFLEGTLRVYRIPLDPKRALKSLVLPAAEEIGVFAITLEG